MPFKPPIPPEKIYPNANPLAIEMLQRLLVFNPSKRIAVDEVRPLDITPHCPHAYHLAILTMAKLTSHSPTLTWARHPQAMPRYLPPQALAHPYLGSLHDSSDEPLAHASF